MEKIKLILKKIKRNLDELDEKIDEKLVSMNSEKEISAQLLSKDDLNEISKNLDELDKIIKKIDENS
ncbi:MAG: hypothetical protein CFH21_00643 [Alphaproteobacteria bacterium MarineAlpha5_Bin11]|nr:hypothetical protein [Pelagibacteraceae bacterium]PPR43847.1 MAG: hypothetical protein CFH21_00643 [Alphaproteobacteria bacterium MarineAlpha5_Bin11]|tara:strand:+ start:1249 stop:1449 length:201 start_codon:yes stop_codon:yes gene_type:complete